MKDRIWEFLQSENKSSSQFAEEIGVQPSGISHIISGRNNPSLDFIIKMLTRYPNLSPDWLLFGKGNMYKGSGKNDKDLFTADYNVHDNNILRKEIVSSPVTKSGKEFINSDEIFEENSGNELNTRPEKIVYFFRDGTFREYFPGKK